MRDSFYDRSEKNRKQIERTSSFIRTAAISVFVIAFIGTVLYFGAIGYLAVKAVDVIQSTDAKETAKGLGELVKSFNEGMGK